MTHKLYFVIKCECNKLKCCLFKYFYKNSLLAWPSMDLLSHKKLGACYPFHLSSLRPLHTPLFNSPKSYSILHFQVSVLHLVVVSILLGAILLIVGLVQLTPNADASQHRYYLMAIGGFLMVLGLVLAALRCCLLPWHMRRRRRLQLLHRVRKDESQASALGVSGTGTQTGTENEKNSQVEMQNGTKPPKTDDIKADYDGLVNAELGLVHRSSDVDPVPAHSSVSSSGDALHTVITSPSEHDALIDESSNSNREQTSIVTT